MAIEIDAPCEHYKNPDCESELVKIGPVDKIPPPLKDPESLLPSS
jgi:hypothetical protein